MKTDKLKGFSLEHFTIDTIKQGLEEKLTPVGNILTFDGYSAINKMGAWWNTPDAINVLLLLPNASIRIASLFRQIFLSNVANLIAESLQDEVEIIIDGVEIQIMDDENVPQVISKSLIKKQNDFSLIYISVDVDGINSGPSSTTHQIEGDIRLSLHEDFAKAFFQIIQCTYLDEINAEQA